jgi:hypothetical protein
MMLSRINLITGVCMLLVACFAPTAKSADKAVAGEAGAALATLVRQVESGRVQSLEVLYIPRYIMNDLRMTPERMRQNYRYKITIQEFSDSGEAAPLLSALKRTVLRSSAGPADLKFAAVFRLVGGGVREVYLDGFGRLGQIDNVPASFQGGLYEWFRKLTAGFK